MTIVLSHRAKALKPSPTMTISALATKMKAEGIDVINFGVGEPDFNTPEYIRLAAKTAIDENFTRYTSALGIPELRKAIANKLLADNQLSYKPNEIIVSPGAKAAIINVLMAVCDPRDEVLIPTPYWVSYTSQVEMLDAIPVLMPTDVSTDFKIIADQLEQAIRELPNPKVLILNSPSNPTGAVYSRTELEQIAAVCLKHRIVIISDEIYEKLIYDGDVHHSIAAISDEVKALTVVINGISKAYAMTGWRLGYAAGPAEIIASAARIQEHTTSCVNSIAQKAALCALTIQSDEMEMMRKEFGKRRNYLVGELNKIEQIHCTLPGGAFYAFPNVSYYLENNRKNIHNSIELCQFLLQEFKIALVPGSGFGADNYVRFSYATSMKNIVEGVHRFSDGLKAIL
ncbi:MAG: pyridoxal phosphate-dependent aminotransferase [Candidatus Marinimicrobia bacterium]|nr:pyridoxal phosphate-dependent aminotransferase [Candidatus Neomarinimicrobiota bacterium]